MQRPPKGEIEKSKNGYYSAVSKTDACLEGPLQCSQTGVMAKMCRAEQRYLLFEVKLLTVTVRSPLESLGYEKNPHSNHPLVTRGARRNRRKFYDRIDRRVTAEAVKLGPAPCALL